MKKTKSKKTTSSSSSSYISSHVHHVLRFYGHIEEDGIPYPLIINKINQIQLENPSINESSDFGVIATRGVETDDGRQCEYPFHYLWLKLTQSFHSDRNVSKTIKERDIKTMIIHQYFFHRPSYEKVILKQDILNWLRSIMITEIEDFSITNEFGKDDDLKAGKDNLYLKYYDKDYSVRLSIIQLLKIHGWRNPYIRGQHEFNNEIHRSLMVELMPLLPTILFILFPLEYLPIFAFTLIYPSLLQSNHFMESTVHLYDKGRNQWTSLFKKYQLRDDKEDCQLVNQLPALSSSSFKGLDLIKNERRRLYSYPFKDSLCKDDYFPFKIDQSLSRAYYDAKHDLTHIDVVFEQNSSFPIYDQLSLSSSLLSTQIQVYLVRKDDHSIISNMILEKVNNLRKKDQIVRYVFKKTRSSMTIPTISSSLSSLKEDEEEEGGLSQDFINHWKGNVKENDGSYVIPEFNKKIRLLTTIDRLYDHPYDKYLLLFKYDGFYGFYTKFDVNKYQFNDKTKYITIFPRSQSHIERINNRDKVQYQSYYKEIRKEGSEEGAIFEGFIHMTGDKKTNPNRPVGPSTVAVLHTLSIEETIGIKESYDINDVNTIVELFQLSKERNIIQIYSPLLLFLNMEYRKCQKSRIKSILHEFDHDPYGVESLRVIVIGKAFEKDIILSVVPLDVFNHDLMTITTNSISHNDIDVIEGTPFQSIKSTFTHNNDTKSRSIYENFINVKERLFNTDDYARKKEYKVILSNQNIQQKKSVLFKPKFGSVKNTFYTTRFHGQFSSFDHSIMSIETISDIRLVLTSNIIISGFKYAVNAIVNILPSSKSIKILYKQDHTTIHLINTRLKKGTTSLKIEFMIEDRKDDIYVENGTIDRFELSFTKIEHDISKIEILYNNETFDNDVLYESDDEEEGEYYIMRIMTTDPKLASYKRYSSKSSSSSLTYLVHDIKQS